VALGVTSVYPRRDRFFWDGPGVIWRASVTSTEASIDTWNRIDPRSTPGG